MTKKRLVPTLKAASTGVLLAIIVGCYDEPGISETGATSTETTTAATQTEATGSEGGTDTSGGPEAETSSDESTTAADAQPCVLGLGRVGVCTF